MTQIADILATRPVLADGAMGTVLYARGLQISRCYDELNLSDPALIQGVHEEYLQAGAEILETNTFGANRFRLGVHGLSDKVEAINAAGVRIARQAADRFRQKQESEIWIAGAVGPLGVRLEPLGKTGLDEARQAFAEQIGTLATAGVDLLTIETMPALNEAREALAAARQMAPELPVVVMVTVDDEGNCLDGASARQAASLLTEWGATAIGVNCSTGPTVVLSAIEAMRTATNLPLAALPNAGLPRAVDGRNVYLCSPEYLASFARRAIHAGAQIVGGCCGTTPNHIRAMRTAIRSIEAEGRIEVGEAVPEPNTPTPPMPLANRSALGKLLTEKKFITVVEITPPVGVDCQREIEGARMLAGLGVHAIHVFDSLSATARMSAQSLCLQIQQQAGIETVLPYSCRNRALYNIQADLLGASSIGLHNVLCITGAPSRAGNYPDATSVFDVDSIGLVNIVRRLNHGQDIGANALHCSTNFVLGVSGHPGAPDIEHELRRLQYKIDAGAEFIFTNPVFDLRLLEHFLLRIQDFRIPVIVGIWPLTSVRNAEYLKNDRRVSMPEEFMLRMAQAETPQAARAEGILIARQMIEAVRPWIEGVRVAAPNGDYAAAAEVLTDVLPTRKPSTPAE